MTMSDTTKLATFVAEIKAIFAQFEEEASKTTNKAAQQRARGFSNDLTKKFKEFRVESLKVSKQ